MTRESFGRTALCFRFISDPRSEWVFVFLVTPDMVALLGADEMPASSVLSARAQDALRAIPDAYEPSRLTYN